MEVEVEVEVKLKPLGMPTQGENTPNTTMRDKRARRVVGPRTEKGFFELPEEGPEVGN